MVGLAACVDKHQLAGQAYRPMLRQATNALESLCETPWPSMIFNRLIGSAVHLFPIYLRRHSPTQILK
jgi:hypothetical protein